MKITTASPRPACGPAKTSPGSATSAVNRMAWLQHKIFQSEDLSSSARLVACVLASFVNDQTLGCFPKISTLAKSTGLGERTVRNALNELADHRLVIKRRHAAGWFNTRNVYELIGISRKTQPRKSPDVPARAAASAPATDSASNRNTDLRNSDRRTSRADKPARQPGSTGLSRSALPALPRDEHERIKVVVRRWQQLSVEPWSNDNAGEHVCQAIDRVGMDRVIDRLNELTGTRALKRTEVLDCLQALRPEETSLPAEAEDWLGNVPDVWARIARDFADNPSVDCPNPFAWLKLVTADIQDRTIRLTAANAATRDQLKHRFFDLLSRITASHGYCLATL